MQNVKWVGAAGAILFLIALWLLGSVPGGGQVDPAQFEQFYVAEERTFLPVVATLLVTLAALALLWFLWELRAGIGTSLAEFGFVSGALGLVLVVAGAAMIAAPAGVQLVGGADFVGVPAAHVLASAGWGTLLIGGGLFLGLSLAVVSAAARRTGSLPDWVTIAGFVAAALQLVASLFIPMFAIPLWFFLAAVTGIGSDQ